MKDKVILLTGGAGFIGAALISKLFEDNIIYIFDNLERDSLKHYPFKNKVTILPQSDITNYEKINIYIRKMKPDIVIHLAAIAGVDNVLTRPIKTMTVNMIGTYNILESLNKHKIKLNKFVNFSTSEVYGSYSYKLGENENTILGSVGEARWIYSVSKLSAEHLCFSYHKEHDFPVVSLRPFNIYGPGQVGDGAIHTFIKNCLNNEDVVIHGDGSQIRSWCYIDDAINFILLCLEKEEAIGNIFNVGNPAGTITTIGLAEKIIKITGSKSKIRFIKIPYCDVELRIPNIEKGKNLLGYEPKISLDDGLERTLKWYKKEGVS